MENIETLLKKHGIEATEEALRAFLTEFGSNYRTIAEVRAKNDRISKLEDELKEMGEQVAKLTDEGEQAEALRQRVAEFEKAEEERKAQAQAEAERNRFRESFDAALGEKRFANDLVRDAVFAKVYEACNADASLSVMDALDQTTKDVTGVWVNPQTDPAKMPQGDITSEKKEELDRKGLADLLFGGKE